VDAGEAPAFKSSSDNHRNSYDFHCECPHIRLWLDGEQSVDYTETDVNISLAGKIGLQNHGGGNSDASCKDFVIGELPGQTS
jgi:hypothetical protein